MNFTGSPFADQPWEERLELGDDPGLGRVAE